MTKNKIIIEIGDIIEWYRRRHDTPATTMPEIVGIVSSIYERSSKALEEGSPVSVIAIVVWDEPGYYLEQARSAHWTLSLGDLLIEDEQINRFTFMFKVKKPIKQV